jgi:hypothetical protein
MHTRGMTKGPKSSVIAETRERRSHSTRSNLGSINEEVTTSKEARCKRGKMKSTSSKEGGVRIKNQ